MITTTRMKIYLCIQIVFVSLLFLLPACQSELPDKTLNTKVVMISSPDELLALFAEKNYTTKAWQAGIHDVPRFYITNITSGWRNNSEKMPILAKKRIFFRLLAPLVLASNETILADRERLLQSDLNSEEDQHWLAALASKYKLTVVDNKLSEEQFEKLKLRVDIVPVSLALAQSAEESGWGTSRFAVQGNALFGQWDYSGKGIKPKNQRPELGDHTIAQFDSPMGSVESYMHNLNTHRAYTRLRQARAVMRAEKKTISGYVLAKTLDKYSERGADYVKSLHAMMRINRLSSADNAVLVGDEIIYLVPENPV